MIAQHSKHEQKIPLKVLMEDYALQKVPDSYRIGAINVVIVFLGMTTSLYFLMIGGLNVYMVGFTRGIIAMLTGVAINGAFALLGGYIGYKEGLSCDLSSRAYGFGKIGSAITSGVYAVVMIGFLAIETSIVGEAISSFLPLPRIALYSILAVLWILLTLFGIRGLSWMNKLLLPLSLVLLGYVLVVNGGSLSLRNLATFQGWLIPGGIPAALTVAMGTPGAAIFVADYTRFVKSSKGAVSVALSFVIPAFLIVPLIGALLAVTFGDPMPGVYFVSVAGIIGAVFVVLAQAKIQAVNSYSTSLALANLHAMTLNFSPGRVVWVVVANLVALALVSAGALESLTGFLEIGGLISAAWATILLTDFYLVKGILKLAPQRTMALENIRTINPIGVLSLFVASIVAWLVKPIFPVPAYVAIIVSLVSYLLGTIVTKGVFTREIREGALPGVERI